MNPIKTWQERLEAHNSTNPVLKKKMGALWGAPDAMRAEIEELRAAIAAQEPKQAITDAEIERIGRNLQAFKSMQFRASQGRPMTQTEREEYEATIAFARAILAAASPNKELVALIHNAQAILAAHLPPDGPGEMTTINNLLGLLDGPESRAALKGIK